MDKYETHRASRSDVDAAMRGIQTILAITDLSTYGNSAVGRASQLAAQHGAALRVLHVITPPLAPRALGRLDSDEARKQIVDAECALQTLVAASTELHSSEVSTQVLTGALLDEILREAEAADLLVLGARGSSPIRHAVLGPTATRLLTKCDRPMLVVKQDAAPPYRRLLVPVDLEDDADTTLQAVLALAPDAEIHVLHAYEVAFEGKLRTAGVDRTRLREYRQAARVELQARLMAMLARHERGAMRFHPHLQHGHAGRLILALSARIDADLIVMSKRSRSKLEDILLGSVTERVLGDARTDVLVIPLLAGEATAAR